MAKTVFHDTSFEIALASRRDQNHGRAVQLADQAINEGWTLVTTRAVIFEIGNALSRRRYRVQAIELLQAIMNDLSRQIVEISKVLYDAAFELFSQRTDKDWGLVDCASFIVMKELQITDALTADEHFEHAGFRVLLRSEV